MCYLGCGFFCKGLMDPKDPSLGFQADFTAQVRVDSLAQSLHFILLI